MVNWHHLKRPKLSTFGWERSWNVGVWYGDLGCVLRNMEDDLNIMEDDLDMMENNQKLAILSRWPIWPISEFFWLSSSSKSKVILTKLSIFYIFFCLPSYVISRSSSIVFRSSSMVLNTHPNHIPTSQVLQVDNWKKFKLAPFNLAKNSEILSTP